MRIARSKRPGAVRGTGGGLAALVLAGLLALAGAGCADDADAGTSTADAASDGSTDAAAETIAAEQAALLQAPFLLIAHRGGRKLWPEHTRVAYDGAVALGVDLIEYDVHATADGVLVVMHDATVDRTTDGTGAIKKMTWAQLSQLDAAHAFTTDGGKTFPYRGKGVRIPRLDELLDSYPGVALSIEIKQYDPPIVEPVVALLEQKGAIGRTILSAFSDPTIQAVRARRPDLLTSLGLGETLTFFAMSEAEAANYQPPAPFVQPEDKQVDAALVARCHAAGLKMQVWTVNDAARMQALLDLGVDGMFTDDPKTLKGLLKP